MTVIWVSKGILYFHYTTYLLTFAFCLKEQKDWAICSWFDGKCSLWPIKRINVYPINIIVISEKREKRTSNFHYTVLVLQCMTSVFLITLIVYYLFDKSLCGWILQAWLLIKDFETSWVSVSLHVGLPPQ